MNSPKAKVHYSEEFENMIISKAIELEGQGLTEGILDERTLGHKGLH